MVSPTQIEQEALKVETNHPVRALVVDSLVGNDYSLLLCRGLLEASVDIGLVTVEGREASIHVAYPMHRWAPPKEGGGSSVGKLKHYLRYLRRLYRHAKKSGNQQVLHFQFFRRERVESFYLWFLRMVGIRLVYTAHNILPHEASRIDRFLKAMVYRSAHAIVVHSQYVKKALLDAFPMPPEKVHVIPHGNFDHYLPAHPVSKAEARKKLGLEEDDHVMLFFGYIREYKGLDVLLEAFALAAAKDSRLKLVVAGAPHTKALEKQYHEMIAQAGFADRIVFHARFIDHDEVEIYFTATDLVVLPYKHIYHSGIVHLAYSYGKPTLATNVGDFSETIEQGKSGVVTDENTPEALCEEMSRLFEDPDSLKEMGQYARNLSVTKYSWLDIGRKTRAVYANIQR